MVYRSGTSRGVLFFAKDLEAAPVSSNELVREQIESKTNSTGVDRRDLIAARIVGSGHVYALEGLGGGRSSTMKSLYIHRPPDSEAVVVKFVQSEIERFGVDETHGDCGNMLPAVGPFAIETGLVRASGGPSTTVKVVSANTGTRYALEVQTIPSGSPQSDLKVRYAGDHAISGVPGTSAPVKVTARGLVGTLGRGLLPTGNPIDTVEVDGESIEVSCVDFSRPMVLVRGEDVGMSGRETKSDCDGDVSLMQKIDRIRLRGAELMGMGCAEGKTSPKIAAVFPPNDTGGNLLVRYFTAPYLRDLHYGLAMTAAQCIGAATQVQGTVAHQLAVPPPSEEREASGEVTRALSFSQPSGLTWIDVVTAGKGSESAPIGASYVRTCSPIMQGDAFYPLM